MKKDRNGQDPKPVPQKSRFYRFVYALFRFPVRWIGRMHVHGAEHEPSPDEGGCLVIANHVTWADPIFLCAALRHRQPHFMAKKELFSIPLLKGLIRSLGAYPVRRGGADVSAIKYTISLLEDGMTVGMFPQGHRYPGVDCRTTPVKSGVALMAVKAGVPVLPVYFKTKGNRARFLGRRDVFVGEPIRPEEWHYDPEAAGEYQRIADFLFERVVSLGDTEREDRHE